MILMVRKYEKAKREWKNEKKRKDNKIDVTNDLSPEVPMHLHKG